jgi:putative spermidine/putrescine transport system permease protein
MNRHSSGAPYLLAPALLMVVVLLGLPLLMIAVNSFNHGTSPGELSLDFSFANYLDIFRDDFYPRVLGRTLMSSLAITALTLVLGFLLALKLWKSRPRARMLLMMIVVAPLLISVVARTYGWLLVLGEKGALNALLLTVGMVDHPVKFLFNEGAVIFGLTHLLVAFPALAIHASLDRVTDEILEAAQIAGASAWRIFADILLPMTIPGVAVGATFSFTLAMSAFVTPALMGGERSALAPLIYQKYIVSYDWGLGAALAVIFLIAALVGTVAITAALTTPYRKRLVALRLNT